MLFVRPPTFFSLLSLSIYISLCIFLFFSLSLSLSLFLYLSLSISLPPSPSLSVARAQHAISQRQKSPRWFRGFCPVVVIRKCASIEEIRKYQANTVLNYSSSLLTHASDCVCNALIGCCGRFLLLMPRGTLCSLPFPFLSYPL